jgi:phosphoribosylformylglycinamidine synthase
MAASFGLTTDEYALAQQILGRVPNRTELGVISVMWSEHCSYKSSRVWLKTLPTTAPWVICGPGENAGVIDIGDGQAAIFKIESHNHPSFIEPYQGAATGVGGIMRDVFTMGARPVANLNALRFGDPSHPKTRQLLKGVVAGISGYGNCMGVPTVAGECEFHEAYNGNILVNAMTVGIADADKIFYAKPAGLGTLVVYVGAKTGRDGIHGATMASAEFTEDSEEKRPTVQVGDPFKEKLLLEACLELMATDAIIAIQDMGAAGLTSSSVEMASKGGLGIRLDLDQVPMREEGMNPYELMLSESQERMLMVLRPDREEQARAIFRKWELDFAVIGTMTDSGRLELRWHGELAADIPVAPLVENSPLYRRPHEPSPALPVLDGTAVALPASIGDTLQQLLAHPHFASRRWIWEQYDRSVMGDTLATAGGDAAMVRIHGTRKALAVTTDCTPRYCKASPVEGGKQAVVETWRNIVATGARPLAVTNNLNFGNPEKPVIMGQFVGCLQGMAEACTGLDYPIVSGNVSLYNETSGQGILPTPVIGGVGLLDDYTRRLPNHVAQEGLTLFLLGEDGTWLGCSRFAQIILKRDAIDAPPPVDVAQERKNGEFVLEANRQGLLKACHDLSDGGLLIALAEMLMGGNVGATLDMPETAAFLFGENQARYVLATDKPQALEQAAQQAGVPLRKLGITEGNSLHINNQSAGTVASLRAGHESWLPAYMG